MLSVFVLTYVCFCAAKESVKMMFFGACKGLFCVAIALLLERKPMGFATKVAE